MIDPDILRHHRGRIRTMAFLAVWCALMFTGALVTAPPERDALWYGGVAFIAAAGLYAALRLPRYRRRVHEARARCERAAVTTHVMKGPHR